MRMKRNHPLFPDTPPPYPPNLSFILELSPSVITLGLGRIERLLDALGNPQRAFKSIIVAGTNGKGSVCALLSALLCEHGCRVGRFISPHVYSVTERVAVQEEPLPLERMERVASRIVPLHREIPFSYFEGLTALAFSVFAEESVEYAVLEVGLGGRFDATNAADPVLSILTSVSLDHRKLLGDTVDEIILEKLGITRTGVPLLCGRLSDGLMTIVRNRAKRDRFPVVAVDEIGTCRISGGGFGSMEVDVKTRKRDYGTATVAFPGVHQADNVVLAVGAAERILGEMSDVGPGLARAYLPGRFEHFLQEGRHVVLDVAHNDAALLGALATLRELSVPENDTLILGVMKRKELFDFPAAALGAAARHYFVRPPDEDACSPQELLARFGVDAIQSKRRDIILVDREWTDAARARFIGRVVAETPRGGVILITGSHRTVELFGRAAARGDRM
jgi:dihydrofolate synthase/folylpolyglutamate synthase